MKNCVLFFVREFSSLDIGSQIIRPSQSAALSASFQAYKPSFPDHEFTLHYSLIIQYDTRLYFLKRIIRLLKGSLNNTNPCPCSIKGPKNQRKNIPASLGRALQLPWPFF